MKVVGTFQDKIVIILVECYGELVEKALRPQQTLEWHLKFWAPYELDFRTFAGVG